MDKQRVERTLKRAGLTAAQTKTKTDSELLEIRGIGAATVAQIRGWWPATSFQDKVFDSLSTPPVPGPAVEAAVRSKTNPPPLVYDFGLGADAQKRKRAGLWVNAHEVLQAISPTDAGIFGDLKLRLRSPQSRAVELAAERKELEIRAERSEGKNEAIGKIKDAVTEERSDREIGMLVLAAGLMMTARDLTRSEQLDIQRAKAVATLRGLRGVAAFSGQHREFTGHEETEDIQELLGPILEVSTAHCTAVLRLGQMVAASDDREVALQGEDYVVTGQRTAA